MIHNGSKYNNQWKTQKLSDLGSFSRGVSKHRPRNDSALFENGKYPLVQTGDIKKANLYVTSHSQEYNDVGLKQSKLWDKGTLCITIAANIAETAILDYPMCFPDSIVGFNAYEGESTELFMYYIFEYIRNSIQNAASGSIQDNINVDYLTSLEFKIPSFKYQNDIVNILSTLDRKIINNSKINDNLEHQAMTLYNHWFTQFDFPVQHGMPYKSSGNRMSNNGLICKTIPDGWKVLKLNDVIEKICTGLNPRNNFVLGNGNIRYVTVKNLTTAGTLDFSGCDTIDQQARRIVHNRSDISVGDILFASIAPLGRCHLILDEPQDWDINESVFSIRANRKYITPEYLYMYLMSDSFIKGATSSSTGSIFKGIRIGTLQDTLAVIPPLEIVNAFTEKVHQLLALKSKITTESEHLIELRDWLLPMLMNGQATIDD